MKAMLNPLEHLQHRQISSKYHQNIINISSTYHQTIKFQFLRRKLSVGTMGILRSEQKIIRTGPSPCHGWSSNYGGCRRMNLDDGWSSHHHGSFDDFGLVGWVILEKCLFPWAILKMTFKKIGKKYEKKNMTIGMVTKFLRKNLQFTRFASFWADFPRRFVQCLLWPGAEWRWDQPIAPVFGHIRRAMELISATKKSRGL